MAQRNRLIGSFGSLIACGVVACCAVMFGVAGFVCSAAAEVGNANEVVAGGVEAVEPRMVQPEDLEQGFIVVVTDNARRASSDSPIYLASNQSGWDPGHASWRLSPRSDGKWQIVVTSLPIQGRMSFKFTRGNWDTVEVTAEYDDVDNRLFAMIDASKLSPGERPVIEFEIPAWRDERPSEAMLREQFRYRTLNVTGTVRRLEVTGGGVPMMRDALVWLPPGYDQPSNANRRYPVLYLLDGQNVFEHHPPTPGEWGADETATRLIEQNRIEPIIIVAIPHAGNDRASEYLPVRMLPGVEPRADAFVEFLVNDVKPRVDRAFRTQIGAEKPAIGGASLGGIAALYAATERPDVFGMALVESPTLTQGDNLARRYFSQRTAWPKKVYFGYGGFEHGRDGGEANRKYVAEARQFAEVVSQSVGRENLKIQYVEMAEHNEMAWARRLPQALQYFFGR